MRVSHCRSSHFSLIVRIFLSSRMMTGEENISGVVKIKRAKTRLKESGREKDQEKRYLITCFSRSFDERTSNNHLIFLVKKISRCLLVVSSLTCSSLRASHTHTHPCWDTDHDSFDSEKLMMDLATCVNDSFAHPFCTFVSQSVNQWMMNSTVVATSAQRVCLICQTSHGFSSEDLRSIIVMVVLMGIALLLCYFGVLWFAIRTRFIPNPGDVVLQDVHTNEAFDDAEDDIKNAQLNTTAATFPRKTSSVVVTLNDEKERFWAAIRSARYIFYSYSKIDANLFLE